MMNMNATAATAAATMIMHLVVIFLPFQRQDAHHEHPLQQERMQFQGKWFTRKIIFRDLIPCGEYNLVVSTRCGDGRDYALRRIGHPVTVP